MLTTNLGLSQSQPQTHASPRLQQGVLLIVFGRLVGHVNAATAVAALGGVVYALWNEFYRVKGLNDSFTALNLKCKRLMAWPYNSPHFLS